MDLQKIKFLTIFRNNVVTFLDELIEQFPEETDLLYIRVFFKDQANIEEVMGHFIVNLLPKKDKIKDRNDAFFLNDNDLLSNFNGDKVNHFKKMWLCDRLDKDEKETVWKWWDIFVMLAEKYKQKYT